MVIRSHAYPGTRRQPTPGLVGINPAIIMWDNGPAHRGEPIRSYLATPNLNLRLVPLPGHSPDYHADEAIWDWIREDMTAHTCLGTKAKVREHGGAFLHGLSARTEDVKRRCRTVLQAQADALAMTTTALIQAPQYATPALALV